MPVFGHPSVATLEAFAPLTGGVVDGVALAVKAGHDEHVAGAGEVPMNDQHLARCGGAPQGFE